MPSIRTVSPATVTLVNGTATLSVTLNTADSVKLSATSGSVTGTSGTINVVLGGRVHARRSCLVLLPPIAGD